MISLKATLVATMMFFCGYLIAQTNQTPPAFDTEPKVDANAQSKILNNTAHENKAAHAALVSGSSSVSGAVSGSVSRSQSRAEPGSLPTSPPVVTHKLSSQDIKDIKTVLKQVLIDDQSMRTLIQEKKEANTHASNELVNLESSKLWQKQLTLDKQNQDIVANILDNYGWPKQTQFKDSEAAQTLFIVIQHADLAFQERFFPMMQKATENGDIPKGAFASLHDSILVGQGLKQRYGTQIKVNEENGTPFFYPIEDERNVDIRRAAVGLGPLVEYAVLYGVEYHPLTATKTEELVIDNRSQDSDSEDEPE